MTTTVNPLETALDAIPEYRAVQAAETALHKRGSQLRNPSGVPQADLAGETIAALMAGKPVPGDLGRRAWEAKQQHEFVSAELGILNALESRIANMKENALHRGAKAALLVLRTALDDFLSKARPMATALRGVHDAEGAIAAGPKAVEAWTQFNQLVGEYANLRRAQYALTRAEAGGETIQVSNHGGGAMLSSVYPVWSEIANVTELWPQYTPTRRDGTSPRPPWPAAERSEPFRIEHNREWLMWVLTTPGVRLWMPTVDELAKAYREQKQDAAEREGKAPRDRMEPRGKRPVVVKGGDGSQYTDFIPA